MILETMEIIPVKNVDEVLKIVNKTSKKSRLLKVNLKKN